MGLDNVGHHVPASTDAPARSAFDKLSRSLRDPFPVANTAARTALLAALAAASPAVVPSASSPIFFHQADLPKAYRTVYTENGSNFISLSGAFVWVDAAARTAATGMATGDKGYQVDTLTTYRYSGSAWKAWESPWAGYIPILTGSITNPSGYTPVGRYVQVGGLVFYTFSLTLSAALGSGYYRISLPVAASMTSIPQTMGSVVLSQTGKFLSGVAVTPVSSALLQMACSSTYLGASDIVRETVPWTFISGAVISGFVIYEAA